MSTIFSGDEVLLALDPSYDNLEVDLPPLTSFSSPEETTNNQPNNVSDAVVVGDTLLQHTSRGYGDQAPITTLPLPLAVHESNNSYLVSPPQNYHLLQTIDHISLPGVYNNTALHQTPMIMANEGGFGHPTGQPISVEELANSSSSHVSFGYQEPYGNPFPLPLMHSGGSMVNQDQYFINKVHPVSPLNSGINDQHPYSYYDLPNLANSSHAMNVPAAWPPSSSAPDHTRFSMPNYSSDRRPAEISPLPSTSQIAFAGAQGGQHINDFVTAPTENSLALQNGSHPHDQWVWDVDMSFNMEVLEDAMPLQIIGSSSSNGGVEDNKKKQKKQVMRWTLEEHIAMLEGVRKYGKGKWKIISREFVDSKSPAQLASHFQKYDVHHKGKEETEGTIVEHKRKKRKSIHDITIDGLGTGNGTAIVAASKAS